MYVELCCKSNFSFLTGASDSREYVLRAKELGMTAIGITDLNGVYGIPRAYEAIRDYAPDIKLICGSEITIENRPSLTLIAKTREGWGLLCRIITQVKAAKAKDEARISYDELRHMQSLYKGWNDLICLIAADETHDFEFLKDLFKNNLYIKICRYLDGNLDRKRLQKAKRLSQKFQISLVASNEVHYHDPKRRALHDVVTCIREKTTLDNAGFKLFKNSERYLKSSIQMEALFSDFPEAIRRTKDIADQCEFSLSQLKYEYPKESVPEGYTAKTYLKKLVTENARIKYRGIIPTDVDARIRFELDYFSNRNEESYFLTLYSALHYARERDIAFQGRGSAAASVVCYLLGFTAVDPVKSKLVFDRFSNPARLDPPDIDIDFEHERREEVIQWIFNHYGRDRAGMVAAVHTYQQNGAYREICKVIGVDVGTRKAAEIKTQFKELAKEFAVREIFLGTLIDEIAGFPRHNGTHSGGFVITDGPLVETVPIEPAAMDGRTIIQWDKHDLETLGMMKLDMLSIGFLTALKKTSKLIGIDWKDIPLEDEKTFKLIQRAETTGCFQIESRAQMNSLPHTKPNTPYEMAIQVALIRPSMSKGGMARPYLKGRENTRRGHPFKSGNEAMDSILGRTHGVALFPDQIMEVSMRVCGFTAAEADQLRRSLGKERSAKKVETLGERLLAGMLNAGIKPQLAQDIVSRSQGFASYGFPEPHAASYGELAFKSAYLKTYYPAEYLCSLINSQPMGFYSIDFLINEAVRNSGVKVLPVHPLKSNWDATMEGHKIVRMGFRNIRKINKDDVEQMLEEREKKMFHSVEDFIKRTTFNHLVLRNLNFANAFDCFGIDRRHAFWKSLAFKNLLADNNDPETLSLFDHAEIEESKTVFKKLSNFESALLDYKILGYSVEGNLMKFLRIEVPHLPQANSKIIRDLKHNTLVHFAGILMVDQRPPPAKGFGFLTLEDENGTIEMVLRPAIYDEFKSVFRSSRFLVCSGRVQRYDRQVTIIAETISTFAPVAKTRSHQPTPRMLDKVQWK